MQDTSIAWADWTWGPIKGCDRISPGCLNCYAEALAARHSVASAKRPNSPFAGFAEFRIVGGKREAHWTGKVELVEHKLLEPLSWRRKAIKFRAEHGRKPRAFISMSDLFHKSLPYEAIDRVFAVAALTPEVNWMFLTKRAARMARYFGPSAELDGLTRDVLVEGNAQSIYESRTGEDPSMWLAVHWPLPNVALGVSIESPKYLDRVKHLAQTPAAMRFVSQEPQLKQIEYPLDLLKRLDMIIVGGESGLGARPFDIAWARSTVEQCRAAGIAPFVKQMGAQVFDQRLGPECLAVAGWAFGTHRDGHRVILRDRKGEDMSEWPADIRVREWPEGWN